MLAEWSLVPRVRRRNTDLARLLAERRPLRRDVALYAPVRSDKRRGHRSAKSPLLVHLVLRLRRNDDLGCRAEFDLPFMDITGYTTPSRRCTTYN